MRARVIVVAGQSGSGKSRLCHRLADELGLPVLNLDDFYKDGSDPSLPRTHLPAGHQIVDWDDPASWLADDAVTALDRLCRTGRCEVPVYELSQDGRVGSRVLDLGPAPYLLAEGVFADLVVEPCLRRGILGDAVCVRNARLLTFWRRLVRDLREGRKRPWVLVRRGLALLRSEPAVVARAAAAGCVVLSSERAYERLRSLAGGRPLGRRG